MNSASRINEILTKVKKAQKTSKDGDRNTNVTILMTWKNIFECESIFDVCNHLQHTYNEVLRLEKESLSLNMNEPMQPHIKTLKWLFTLSNLDVTIDSIQNRLTKEDTNSLNFLDKMLESEILKDEHSYNENTIDLTEFINTIDSLLSDIQTSNISNTDKSIFISFLSDLEKGTRLYPINGVDALITALQDNICKYNLISSSLSEKYSGLKKKASFLVGEVLFWANTIKKSKKSYAQLKNAIEDMTKISTDEEVIDIEEEE